MTEQNTAQKRLKSSASKSKNDAAPVASTNAGQTPAITDAQPAQFSAEQILQLQQTIGNHAVQRLLNNIQRVPGDPPVPGRPRRNAVVDANAAPQNQGGQQNPAPAVAVQQNNAPAVQIVQQNLPQIVAPQIPEGQQNPPPRRTFVPKIKNNPANENPSTSQIPTPTPGPNVGISPIPTPPAPYTYGPPPGQAQNVGIPQIPGGRQNQDRVIPVFPAPTPNVAPQIPVEKNTPSNKPHWLRKEKTVANSGGNAANAEAMQGLPVYIDGVPFTQKEIERDEQARQQIKQRDEKARGERIGNRPPRPFTMQGEENQPFAAPTIALDPLDQLPLDEPKRLKRRDRKRHLTPPSSPLERPEIPERTDKGASPFVLTPYITPQFEGFDLREAMLEPTTPERPAPLDAMKPNIVSPLPTWPVFLASLSGMQDPTRRTNSPAAGEIAGRMGSEQGKMMQYLAPAYQDYDMNKSPKNLVKLHGELHRLQVMFGNHDLLLASGLNVPAVMGFVQKTMEKIEHKIATEYGRSEIMRPNTGERQDKVNGKYKFMVDIGVPIEFCRKNKEHLKLFRNFHNGLFDKEHGESSPEAQQVPEIMKELEEKNIPGFKLIKGVFLTKFPKATGIADLQDRTYKASTDTKEQAYELEMNQYMAGQEIDLTNPNKKALIPDYLKSEAYTSPGIDIVAERQALLENNQSMNGWLHNLSDGDIGSLLKYTRDDYDSANKKLRANDGSDQKEPKSKDYEDVADFRRKLKNKVIVSSMNKVPPYEGITYRMMNNFADFEAAVHVGGVFTDLAFMSASMTLEGAEDGGTSGAIAYPGALNIYEIITSKSGRKLGALSKNAHETEVLFAPGTRFRIVAIWMHIDGKVPQDAPPEVKRILYRNDPIKVRDHFLGGKTTTYKEKVKVVVMTEM